MCADMNHTPNNSAMQAETPELERFHRIFHIYQAAIEDMAICGGQRPKGHQGIAVDTDIWARRYQAAKWKMLWAERHLNKGQSIPRWYTAISRAYDRLDAAGRAGEGGEDA